MTTWPNMQDYAASLASQRSHKCDFCSKSFTNSSYLSQHLRIHLRQRPYGPCVECGKSFTQLSHLKQHMRTHSGERPYRCDVRGCTKAYTQLCNLQMHSRTHQADKKFNCKSCYKSFADRESLMAHIPKHLETKHRKTIICQYCGKSYAQDRYLPLHIRKQHHSELKRIQEIAEQFKTMPSPTWFQEQAVEIDLLQPGSSDQTQIPHEDHHLLTPEINAGEQLPYCELLNEFLSSYNHSFDASATMLTSDPCLNSLAALKWSGLRNYEAGQAVASGNGCFK